MVGKVQRPYNLYCISNSNYFQHLLEENSDFNQTEKYMKICLYEFNLGQGEWHLHLHTIDNTNTACLTIK